MNAKNDGFMAQSPPAWDSFMPSSPKVQCLFRPPPPPGSPLSGPHWGSNRGPAAGSPLAGATTAGLGITAEVDHLSPEPALSQPASSISILPSSMPAYHQALMSGTAAAAATTASCKPKTPLDRFTPVVTNPPSAAPQRRIKQTKWQFGIRSRNAPLEAVGCIYRALRRLGAEWVDHTHRSSPSTSSSDDEADEDAYSSSPDQQHVEHAAPPPPAKRAPKDPWIIQARWRKFAPKRKADDPPPPPTSPGGPRDEECVFVHLTIQLYQLEHDNYLVDFKCAGYERLAPKQRKKVGFEEALGGDVDGRLKEGSGGRKEDYKEVNSPFPFLDAAGALIIALAEAGD